MKRPVPRSLARALFICPLGVLATGVCGLPDIATAIFGVISALRIAQYSGRATNSTNRFRKLFVRFVAKVKHDSAIARTAKDNAGQTMLYSISPNSRGSHNERGSQYVINSKAAIIAM